MAQCWSRVTDLHRVLPVLEKETQGGLKLTNIINTHQCVFLLDPEKYC